VKNGERPKKNEQLGRTWGALLVLKDGLKKTCVQPSRDQGITSKNLGRIASCGKDGGTEVGGPKRNAGEQIDGGTPGRETAINWEGCGMCRRTLSNQKRLRYGEELSQQIPEIRSLGRGQKVALGRKRNISKRGRGWKAGRKGEKILGEVGGGRDKASSTKIRSDFWGWGLKDRERTSKEKLYLLLERPPKKKGERESWRLRRGKSEGERKGLEREGEG